jgi:hypothetical protein
MAAGIFDALRHDLPAELAALVSGRPVHRNDEEVFPLQAAHTIAWLHRRYAHEYNLTCDLADWKPKQTYLKKLGEIPTLYTWYPYERLAKLLLRAQKELAAGA